MNTYRRNTMKHGALTLLLLGIALTLNACSSKGDKAPTAAEASDATTADKDKMTKEYVRQRVEAIYADVFAAYIKANEDGSIPKQDFDKKYCSKAWNKTVAAVNKKDAQHPDWMPFFESDYWVCGQDFSSELHIKDVKVVEIFEKTAHVEFTHHNFSDKPEEIVLVFERGDWYIENFIEHDDNPDAELNWMEVMESYLNE